MSDGRTEERLPPPLEPPMPVEAAEVASAGRSCLVILVLAVAVVLVLCVGIALRWASLQ